MNAFVVREQKKRKEKMTALPKTLVSSTSFSAVHSFLHLFGSVPVLFSHPQGANCQGALWGDFPLSAFDIPPCGHSFFITGGDTYMLASSQTE